MHEHGDQTPEGAEPEGTLDSTPEEGPPETCAQELERLIEQKRGEETEARGRAAKLAAKLKGMPSEGGKSIDPHKTKTLWSGLALGVLKGGLQAINERQREATEKGLRDAEAAEEQARADRRTLEGELDRERRGAGPGAATVRRRRAGGPKRAERRPGGPPTQATGRGRRDSPGSSTTTSWPRAGRPRARAATRWLSARGASPGRGGGGPAGRPRCCSRCARRGCCATSSERTKRSSRRPDHATATSTATGCARPGPGPRRSAAR